MALHSTPLRVALHARFSSELQRNASIEDQIRICRKRAEERGYEVVKVYVDRPLSRAPLVRLGMQELLRDADARLFDVVLAEALDRCSRRQADIATAYVTLSFLDAFMEAIAEGQITELHIGLKGTMNALYLKDLGDKTHRGLEGRGRAGKSAGGGAYGYRTVPAGAATDSTPLRGAS